MPRIAPLALLALLSLLPTATGSVVINEILYHAPNDLDDLEYIELHNPGGESVDLGGWALTKGIQFRFAPGTRIEADGYLVLCRSLERFQEFYSVPVAGTFKERLSDKGERVELTDAAGKVADTVHYRDTAPWPMGADGLSGALERICPSAGGDDPDNWMSSPLSDDRDKPGGTPGQRNAAWSATLPPVFTRVTFTPATPAPDESITVEAELRDPAGTTGVSLAFRLAGPGFEKPETTVSMNRLPSGRYGGTIPGQNAGSLIRFRVQATATNGAQRWFPAATDPRPALSCYVPGPLEPARIPFGWIIHTTASEAQLARQRINSTGFGPAGRFGPGGFNDAPPDPMEAARNQARSELQRGLDLSLPWFAVTVVEPGADGTVAALRPLFLSKLAERNRLVTDILKPDRTKESLAAVPETIRTFLQGLSGAAQPHLTPAQRAVLEESIRHLTNPPTPFTRMITGRADLEGAWHALTLNAEPDPARMTELRRAMGDLERKRRAILAEVAAGTDRDNGFRDQRDRAETLGESLPSALKPGLTEAQNRQLEAWRNQPREVTVGLRPPPPSGNAPQRGVAGGPGPERGFGAGGFGPGGFGGRGRQAPAAPSSHQSAFVHFDPETRTTTLFDFVQISPRKGGNKVRLLKGQTLNGMTTINLIYEGEDAALVEPLAYEVYRRSGMATEQSGHIRLWIEGQPAGYYIVVEQPNRAFLRRHQIRDNGNMYKLLWFERGVEGQHEKKTNVRAGHEDIVKLVEALQSTSGDAQWELIRNQFDVPQVATYFAVNMVLSHWDGFFNNYFTYHDLHGTGQWSMYPWDQDSTWGLRVMGGGGDVFTTMPITFGMNGDNRGGGGFGRGGGWWRPPGWFSGPLLANPQFRKVFLARTREILDTVYTQETFEPVIQALGDRLKPEVRYRAELFRGDPDRASQQLERTLGRLREHLKKRREFLLAQDEVRNARPLTPADLEAMGVTAPRRTR